VPIDIKLKVLPHELDAIDTLWSIGLENENKDVSNGAIDLLVGVYTNSVHLWEEDR
jgi:hypothetical protein